MTSCIRYERSNYRGICPLEEIYSPIKDSGCSAQSLRTLEVIILWLLRVPRNRLIPSHHAFIKPSSHSHYQGFGSNIFIIAIAVALCIGNVGCKLLSQKYSFTGIPQVALKVYQVGVPL